MCLILVDEVPEHQHHSACLQFRFPETHPHKATAAGQCTGMPPTMHHLCSRQGQFGRVYQLLSGSAASIFLPVRLMAPARITGERSFDHGAPIYHAFPSGIIPLCQLIHHRAGDTSRQMLGKIIARCLSRGSSLERVAQSGPPAHLAGNLCWRGYKWGVGGGFLGARLG